MNPRPLTPILACLLVCGQPLAAAAPSPATRPAANPPLAQAVRLRAAAALDQLQSDQDLAKARKTLADLFDQVLTSASVKDAESFTEAAFHLRLVTQLQTMPAAARMDLLKYLRANQNLARTLAFLIQPRENPAAAYALLDRLRRDRGDSLDAFASLAAAVCVVHARPLTRHVNENLAKSDDPLKIFDYFARNEARMLFRIKPVPAELLIYVVDTTASIDEMEWALQRYANDPKVGARFFDIKYDLDYLRTGSQKQLTLQGFSLPNILRFGGICVDQAYFASTVGKAIGVPTAVASASAGEAGHAWVGFLQSTGRQGWWNFDMGRYSAYRGIRGMVNDPQLRQPIPDSYVSLLAELIPTPAASRHASVALTDAAIRLAQLDKTASPPDSTLPTSLAKPRSADIASQLELLDAAVRLCPANRIAWFAVRDLAGSGKLSLDQKRRWANSLEQLCGPKYPDFTVALLTPMIQTVDNVQEQERLWNEAFSRFQARADLAAGIRMSQAAMWESQNQTERAGMCYMDVIERFANAGPFVIEALQKAEKALIKAGRPQRVPVLYEQTWNRIDRPKDAIAGTFATQSNWYRVGRLYADKLQEAGESQQAAGVRAELQARTGIIAPQR